MSVAASSAGRLATEAPWPEVGRAGAALLCFAGSPVEREALEQWARAARPEDLNGDVEELGADASDLGDRLSALDAARPVVPVRVAWLPREVAGERSAGLVHMLSFTNPRRPGLRAQERIARREPDRCRVVVGEPATVGDLRERCVENTGSSDAATLGAFVRRQGVLALERAERVLVGDHYKVPRLVSEDMQASAGFRSTVQRMAQKLGRPEAEITAEAVGCLDEMVASQSRLALDGWMKFGRWLGRAYSFSVDRTGLTELRRLNRKHALVFLPSHRSYLDPLLLRPVIQRVGFPPNHIFGGANVSFWPIGPVARRTGYVFIRRSFKDAPVYKAVLREYMAYLVRKRFNLEWYIEGGRTRTGKLRPPRYGLLNYLVEAFRDSGADDVYLVPVSLVYDQLHEVGAMAAEEHGATKRPEGLAWLIDYARAQSRGFGRVHVTFGEPLSLVRALEDDGSVPKVAFEVCHRINRVTPITPTAIVTLALLGVEDRAVTVPEGRSLLAPLLDYAAARRLPTTPDLDLETTEGFVGSLRTLVREGVVTEFTGGSEPVYAIGADRHLEAAFYRNNVIHFFLTRAIVELAIVHAGETDAADPVEACWEEALRLRDLLKFEFFFPRKRDFLEEIRAEAALIDPDWERRPAEPEQAREVLAQAPLYLADRVLGPFVEAYQVVADKLAGRDPAEPLEQKEFLAECRGEGRQRQLQKRLRSPESISSELFKGALRLAENRELVPARGEPEGLTAQRGGEELAERRRQFAAEVADVARRIEVVRGLAVND